MDAIIVSVNSRRQEDYWQRKLKALRGIICKCDAAVIAIHEDWEKEGAGSFLGPLYAYQRAQEKAKFMYRIDLYELQRSGKSIAVYHSAGPAKKLYPLIASTLNDKSLLKLPGSILGKRLTLLEAIIAQTNSFYPLSNGRLYVFPCEYILPASPQSPAFSHVDLLASHPAFFSLSPQMTFALLREFKKELEEKSASFSSTLDLWMAETSQLASFKEKFAKLHSEDHYLGLNTLGDHAPSLDFSSTQAYYHTLLKLASLNPEGQSIRHFFKVHAHSQKESPSRVIIDKESCLINCKIGSGKITASTLIDVEADSLEAHQSVFIDCKFNTVKSNRSLFYQVREPNKMRFSQGTIRADIITPGKQRRLPLYSHLGRDSSADWNVRLPQNPFSFKHASEIILKET